LDPGLACQRGRQGVTKLFNNREEAPIVAEIDILRVVRHGTGGGVVVFGWDGVRGPMSWGDAMDDEALGGKLREWLAEEESLVGVGE
jgi:hypothetical protein